MDMSQVNQQAPIGSPPNAPVTIPPVTGNPSMNNGNEILVSPTAAGPSFSKAPGDGRTTQTAVAAVVNENGVLVMDYKTDFPELPLSDINDSKSKGTNAWNRPLAKLKSTNTTQVFHLPPDERSTYRGAGEAAQQFGAGKSQEQDRCNDIAQQTGTQIELFESKDHTLTIVLTGKRGEVEEARKRVVQSLQMQASRDIRVPKDYHRVIIGREGKRLRELEAETDCKIQVPGRDMNTDVIKVSGPREGIERALHKIQAISDEQSKLAQEHLLIPRMFYPWIRGPYNDTITRIQTDTGARVNIPPPSANSEVITVTGEKEGVYAAARAIKAIFEEQKNICKPITCDIAKSQHRYIIGPQGSGLAEILKETGVAVEVPDEKDNSNTITLRGDPEKLAVALPLVYARASSVITMQLNCPNWLHRHIIGPKGAGIRAIVGEPPSCQVEFESEGNIYIEGSPEHVKGSAEKLRCLIEQMQKDMDFHVIKVSPAHHRHLIGKGGSVIGKLKDDHGVQVNVPDEKSGSDEIRIEGPRKGVKLAAEEMMVIANRLENEKTRDIVIEQRLHRLIIGQAGAQVRELRDKFPGVQINFPEAGRKSDLVQLRGPRDQIDKCYKHMEKITKDLKEANFQVRVPIFKDFHRAIIGKGGRTITKIRDDTECRIDFPPAENTGDEAITVTGKKQNVEKAVQELKRIQDELAKVTSVDINIPHKLHSRLLGGGGRLIADISEQCGGVHVKFPDAKLNSDIVNVRGPKDDVDRASKLLADLAKDKELSGFEDTVKFNPQFRRFLIGRNGTNIKKIRDVAPEVRIMLPREQDADQETIHIMGRKEDVPKVKAALEAFIKELNETVEVFMDVDPKYHRHFIIRGAAVLHDIQEQCGNAMISFPRQGSDNNKVSIKGSKECCEDVKRRIAEVLHDLENTVTHDVEIPQEFHRTLLANRGYKIHDIQQKHKVQIKFPERNFQQQQQQYNNQAAETNGAAGDAPQVNGDAEHVNGTPQTNGHDARQDMIMVTGTPEQIEAAKAELLALVPITKEYTIPFDMHRSLIGKAGAEIRKFTTKHDVQLRIPSPNEQSDQVLVIGLQANVDRACEELAEKVSQYDDMAKDRELRGHSTRVDIDPQYHQRIIGPRGQNINQLRATHDVQIIVPTPERVEHGASATEIIIVGYEKNAEECKQALLDMINKLESAFRQEITIDVRIHSRLIGQRGRTIRKTMDDFGVEVTFPRQGDDNPNLIVVSGQSEDAVYDCVDYLRNMEEEYMQDVNERQQYQAPSRQPQQQHQAAPNVVSFTNAPWSPNAPDVSSVDDFPAMGLGAPATGQPAVASAWARR